MIPCGRMLRACVAAAVVAAVAAVAAPAHAYEFWLRTQSIGQAYRLRDYRLFGPDLIVFVLGDEWRGATSPAGG